MKILKAIFYLLCGIFLGLVIAALLPKQIDNKNSYPTIKVEQLDSLRKVYRVNIEVNDIYLHGEIYKIKP